MSRKVFFGITAVMLVVLVITDILFQQDFYLGFFVYQIDVIPFVLGFVIAMYGWLIYDDRELLYEHKYRFTSIGLLLAVMIDYFVLSTIFSMVFPLSALIILVGILVLVSLFFVLSYFKTYVILQNDGLVVSSWNKPKAIEIKYEDITSIGFSYLLNMVILRTEHQKVYVDITIDGAYHVINQLQKNVKPEIVKGFLTKIENFFYVLGMKRNARYLDGSHLNVKQEN